MPFSIDDALKHHVILCTGPAWIGTVLKDTTEKDRELIPFKKIFVSTNDPKNVGITFRDQKAEYMSLQSRGKQLDCLNAILSTIRMAVNDPSSEDDDIIIFKHETVYINDMNLVKKAIQKILDGYDIVIKYWKGGYYHSDSFYIKVSAARPLFCNHSLIESFTKDYQFCEDYLTKHIVKHLKRVYQIDYYHSSWKDNELGFYHIPRYEEASDWYWDKKNYQDLYE